MPNVTNYQKTVISLLVFLLATTTGVWADEQTQQNNWETLYGILNVERDAQGNLLLVSLKQTAPSLFSGIKEVPPKIKPRTLWITDHKVMSELKFFDGQRIRIVGTVSQEEDTGKFILTPRDYQLIRDFAGTVEVERNDEGEVTAINLKGTPRGVVFKDIPPRFSIVLDKRGEGLPEFTGERVMLAGYLSSDGAFRLHVLDFKPMEYFTGKVKPAPNKRYLIFESNKTDDSFHIINEGTAAELIAYQDEVLFIEGVTVLKNRDDWFFHVWSYDAPESDPGMIIESENTPPQPLPSEITNPSEEETAMESPSEEEAEATAEEN